MKLWYVLVFFKGLTLQIAFELIVDLTKENVIGNDVV